MTTEQPKRQTIAVSGGKGGTGKSMVATALAVTLTKRMKTLLVDADVECPNDHLILDTELKERGSVRQTIPVWNIERCTRCGICATICKKDAILFVPEKYPAFVSSSCVGCGACIAACPNGAISESEKVIGKIFTGKNHDVELISGELTLGELASGDVVSELRESADAYRAEISNELTIIDSAAGVGCPVIASLRGTDYIVAVTEPTPSALHDLKRVVYLARQFKTPCGIIINKHDLEESFCRKIEEYARSENIPLIGKIPYRQDFIRASIQMKPMPAMSKEYAALFQTITTKLLEEMKQ